MSDGKGDDDGGESGEASKRHHQAGEKQERVHTVDHVSESEADELLHDLVPAGIEPDDARIAVQLEGANAAAGRKKPYDGQRSQAEPAQPRLERESRPLRANRIFEQD